jgi:myo-inositol-1(or 4)-monophosphatase
MPVRSPTINVMAEAALKASRALVRDFGEVEQLQVSRKGPADFVSAAELKAEKTLRRELSKARPDYGFLLVEGGEIEGDGRNRWIVDPLDGTLNFLHGLPHFAISIGLERDGDIVAGLIHDPIRYETFWAEKGAGAFLNDKRLRVSERRRLDESIIATGVPFMGRAGHAPYLAQIAALMPLVAGIRRYGSAALDLAYVAAGRYEGFWETGLSIWDIAAGILIVRESGGFVSEMDGRNGMLKSGNVLAANAKLHGELMKTLRNA